MQILKGIFLLSILLISCNSNDSKNLSSKNNETEHSKIETTNSIENADTQKIVRNPMKIYSMDIESILKESFSTTFSKYKFEKIKSNIFRNNHCSLRVKTFDPFTIRMEFANNNSPDEFYMLYPYLCLKLRDNYYDLKPSLFTPEYHKYDNEELAIKEFYKYLSSIAETHLKEPFSGDFSWDKDYHEVYSFLLNKRKIISENELYSELKPLLKNFKQEAIRNMNKAALKIYFEQKDAKH